MIWGSVSAHSQGQGFLPPAQTAPAWPGTLPGMAQRRCFPKKSLCRVAGGGLGVITSARTQFPPPWDSFGNSKTLPLRPLEI